MKTCPRCKTGMSPLEYEGVPIDRCDRCRGEWLDGGELKRILDAAREHPEASAEVEALKQPKIRGVLLAEVRENLPCPACGQTMEAFNYAGDTGIILDRCRHCGGIWLDAGELEKVQHVIEAADETADQDFKRYSGRVRQVANRQDALAGQDARTTPAPGEVS